MRDAAALIAAVTGGHQPEHAWVRSGALRVHCLLWGDAADPPVMLVHGNGGHAHWWDALVPYLIAGHRLVAPDLRGHGESDWPAEVSYGIESFAADLAAVCDAFASTPSAVIAHSMGARAAAWFAARHPARVHALALLDTSLAGVDAETARRYRGKVVGQRQGHGYASYAAACDAFRFVPPEPDVAPAITADLAHHAIHERGPDDWTYRFDRGVLGLAGDGAGDLTELVSGLRCRLWVGRGRGSELADRPDFARLKARRPDIELHDFAGGHHFFLSHPPRAGAALRAFVDRLPPPPR